MFGIFLQHLVSEYLKSFKRQINDLTEFYYNIFLNIFCAAVYNIFQFSKKGNCLVKRGFFIQYTIHLYSEKNILVQNTNITCIKSFT